MTQKISKKIVLIVLILISIPILFALKESKARTVLNKPAGWAETQLQQMTLDEKIGQFFMVAAYSGKGDAHMQTVENNITKYGVGGVIWFQGNKEDFLNYSKKMQAVSKIPLLYGMDAEWGVSMRLESEERFPYAYTVGAADDIELSARIAEMMAQECRDLGIHMNFSPVADVNSNPNNPVIGFRSFGENPEKVGNHVAAFVKGFEQNGIISSVKHFPGHGDTDVDSHLDLPLISKSFEEIDAIDWLPFREGIRNGTSSIMVGHLSVPALDSTGTPSSLSRVIIKDYLQGKLGFKGLVISDALNMKAVADRYGKIEVVVKAFEAGCDILLFSESVGDAIQAIKKKVESGEISLEEINSRCLKVLRAKEKFIINPPKHKVYSKGQQEWARYEAFEKSTVLLKNDTISGGSEINKGLPLSRLDQRIMHLSIGNGAEPFVEMSKEFGQLEYKNLSFDQVNSGAINIDFSDYSTIILTVHANSVRPKNQFGTPAKLDFLLSKMPKESNVVLTFFGNPLVLKSTFNLTNIDAVICAYEGNKFVQNRVAQMIFGAIPIQGKLPFTVSETYKRGFGLQTIWNGRLKFSQPEELGIDPAKFNRIDEIVNNAIKEKAFPGCQIVAAVKGKIIFRKSYGTQKYDDVAISNTDVYDIASITKVAASTMSIMKLQSDGKFSLDKQLSDYIPEVTGTSPYGSILLRDMLAHRAGLKSWIPFYKHTQVNGTLNTALYSTTLQPGFTTKVDENLYILDSYTDSMYNRIMRTPLGSKSYEYSDLGYYFVKKIIEKQTNEKMDVFLNDAIYAPMGLFHTAYNPYLKFKMNEIIPTEDDRIYRNRIVQGYVHDPGAAMIGGVGGHAGLFCNATDLAAIFQLFLNGGKYGGVQFIDPAVLAEYTKVQFAGNRRGAGFDKPKLNGGGGTCTVLASPESYGHSGFTGTLAWVDPKNNINFVFLSNRVYPDAENWKIVNMNIRTDIQKVIYEAISSSR